MYDDSERLPFNAGSEFNERKFQFILDYCLAERKSERGTDMDYAHNRNDLIDSASELYEKALEKCQ